MQSLFDQALADTYVGKYILIGITYLNYEGKLLEHIQTHGTVESVSPDGIAIALGGLRGGSHGLCPRYWNLSRQLILVFITYALQGKASKILTFLLLGALINYANTSTML